MAASPADAPLFLWLTLAFAAEGGASSRSWSVCFSVRPEGGIAAQRRELRINLGAVKAAVCSVNLCGKPLLTEDR
jgi:hypothetical protein